MTEKNWYMYSYLFFADGKLRTFSMLFLRQSIVHSSTFTSRYAPWKISTFDFFETMKFDEKNCFKNISTLSPSRARAWKVCFCFRVSDFVTQSIIEDVFGMVAVSGTMCPFKNCCFASETFGVTLFVSGDGDDDVVCVRFILLLPVNFGVGNKSRTVKRQNQ